MTRQNQWLNTLEFMWAEADHPVTPLNPSRYFEVYEWKCENGGKLYVRGRKTMWFHVSLCKFWTPAQVREFEQEVNSHAT